MKTTKNFIAAFFLAVFCVGAQPVTPVIPSTDSGYGTNRVPPGGGWFGRAGIPGGIPTNYTVWCDPTVSIPGTNILVPTDGVTDCSTALQAAMNLCPSNGVVQLPAGTFLINTNINIGSYKILRGAGSSPSNGTVINWMCLLPGQPTATALTLTAGGYSYGACQTTNDLTYGSNVIYLDWNYWTNHPYTFQTVMKPGAVAVISQTNDPAIVTMYNELGGIASWGGVNNGSNAMTQMVMVTNVSVDPVGQSVMVQLEHPFYWTYSRTNFPFFMPTKSECYNSGIEHLSIYTLNTNKSGSTGAINIKNACRCWVSDVEIDHFPRDGVFVNYGYECEVDHCFLNVAQYNDSGDGYGYHIFGPNSDVLIADNIALGCRHSLIFEAGGSGCVYAYNYCIGDANWNESPSWVTDDCVTHASHPYMNLFEGNTFHKLCWDNVHGSSSHNTAFRNFITMALNDTNLPIVKGVPAPYLWGHWSLSWETWNTYENAVDNVLETRLIDTYQKRSYYTPTPLVGDAFTLRLGFADEGGQVCVDSRPASTGYINGNYDYVTGGIVLSNAISTEFPPSLYITNQPSWWSNNIPWPPYGGDLSPMVGLLPAQLRYYAIRNTPYLPITPPSDLKASSPALSGN